VKSTNERYDLRRILLDVPVHAVQFCRNLDSEKASS
jgi:hypothetical protein